MTRTTRKTTSIRDRTLITLTTASGITGWRHWDAMRGCRIAIWRAACHLDRSSNNPAVYHNPPQLPLHGKIQLCQSRALIQTCHKISMLRWTFKSYCWHQDSCWRGWVWESTPKVSWPCHIPLHKHFKRYELFDKRFSLMHNAKITINFPDFTITRGLDQGAQYGLQVTV